MEVTVFLSSLWEHADLCVCAAGDDWREILKIKRLNDDSELLPFKTFPLKSFLLNWIKK